MQKYTLKKGTTSKILMIDIYDSSSTVGARLAGLVYNSAGLSAYYNREGAAGAATAITLATATKGTWATGGFIAIDATNMPGHYELHIPDAALATGANSVLIELKGATNMVPKTILIELVDNVEADTFARIGANGAGLTALGDTRIANLDAAVSTRSTYAGGAVASVTAAVTVGTNNDKTGYALSSAGVQAIWDALTSALTTVGSIGKLLVDNINATISSRASATDYTSARAAKLDILDNATYGNSALDTDLNTLLTRVPTEAAQKSHLVNGTGNITPPTNTGLWDRIDAAISTRSTYAGGAVASVTAAVTVGTNNDKTGYALSSAGVQAIWDALTSALTTVGSIGKLLVDNINAAVSSVKTKTDQLTFTVANQVDANAISLNGNASSASKLQRSTAGIVTGTVGSGSTTTSIITSSLSPAATVIDQFKGKIVTFDSNTTTAALRGQSTDITTNTAAGVLTVTALTTAPVSGDTFVIT